MFIQNLFAGSKTLPENYPPFILRILGLLKNKNKVFSYIQNRIRNRMILENQ